MNLARIPTLATNDVVAAIWAPLVKSNLTSEIIHGPTSTPYLMPLPFWTLFVDTLQEKLLPSKNSNSLTLSRFWLDFSRRDFIELVFKPRFKQEPMAYFGSLLDTQGSNQEISLPGTQFFRSWPGWLSFVSAYKRPSTEAAVRTAHFSAPLIGRSPYAPPSTQLQ